MIAVGIKNLSPQEYLEAHGLKISDAEKFGLILDENKISIPIKDKNRVTLFWKHRHLTGNIKYTYDKGACSAIFGLHMRPPNTKELFIVEGEMDAMAFFTRNISAVSGTGGSSTWKDEWSAELKHYPLTILYDRDEAGAKGAYNVWSSFIEIGVNPRIAVIPEGCGKDVSEYLLTGPIKPLKIFQLPMKILEGNKKIKLKSLDNIMEWIDKTLEDEKEKAELEYILKPIRQKVYEEWRELKKPEKKLPIDLETGEVVKLRVDDAKMVPLDRILKFNSAGFAPCPFHTEKTASFKWYRKDNRGHCFGCGRQADGIDIVCQLYSLKFPQGVEHLLNL